MEIDYNASTYPTKDTIARHYYTSTQKTNPSIKIYISKLNELIEESTKKNSEKDYFQEITKAIIFTELIERVCLEARLNNTERCRRGWGKKRIKGRCEPYKDYSCKIEYITSIIFNNFYNF